MATNWKASLPKKRLSKRFKFNGGSQFLGNTGTGENNTVEPSKPTAMLNTGLGPRMVHEGEDLVKLANGDTQVIPANQSQLGQMEQRQGIPGMALGGRLKPPGGNPASGVVDVLNQTVNPTTSTDVGLNVGEPITNPTDQQTVTPLLPGQTEQNVALGLGAPVATGGASGEFQSFQPAGAQGGPPVPPATDPITPTGLTGIGDQAVAKGLGGLEAIAAGESPVDRTIANRTLGNLGAQQEAERMAAIQAQAQQGVTGPAAQAQQGMLGIAQGSQMGQTAGQLAIGSQERAVGATKDLAVLGQAQQMQDVDLRNAAESDLTGYLQNAATSDPNYNWRTDQGAQQKLQRAWEAQGNAGQFSEQWADGQMNIASQNPIDAFATALLTSDWYNNLPDVGVVDAAGNVTTPGKDTIQGAMPQLQLMQAFGTNLEFRQNLDGTYGLVDGSTGLGFGDDPTNSTSTVSSFDVSDPASVSQATTIMSDNLFDGVSDSGTSQWMQSNPDGDWPPAEQDWNNWSMSDRTWDSDSPDDMLALRDMLAWNAPDVGDLGTDQLSLYLATHGNKVGSVQSLKGWAATAGSADNVTAFFNGSDTSLDLNDRKLLEKSLAAKSLLAGRDGMSDDEWVDALAKAGFKNETELNAYAGAVDHNDSGMSLSTPDIPGAGATQEEWRNYNAANGWDPSGQLAPGTEPVIDEWGAIGGNVNPSEFDVGGRYRSEWLNSDVTTAGYSDVGVVGPTPQMQSFADNNAGSTVDVDGVNYVINPEQPLGFTVNDGVGTYGLNVYDPTTNAWKVYVPYKVTAQTSSGDYRASQAGLYDIYTGTEYGNPNEIFNSTYE